MSGASIETQRHFESKIPESGRKPGFSIENARRCDQAFARDKRTNRTTLPRRDQGKERHSKFAKIPKQCLH